MSQLLTTLVAGTAFAAIVLTGANTAHAVDPEPVIDDCRKDISVKFGGQVNRAFLYGDNGEVDDTFFVDNDNSSTRLRARAKGQINCDLSVGAQIEVQFESNSSAAIRFKQNSSAGPNNFTERKLEVWFDSETWGRIWLGQGDTASNGTSEVDLSGTAVVAYSSIEDMAGGLEFENGVRIRDASTNLDGLSRQDRVRYDTPTIAGFQLSTSVTDQNHWDLALRYAQKFGGHKFAAAIAYVNQDFRQGGDYDYQVAGAASLLLDNGLNFTVAAGMQEDNIDGRGATTDPFFFYAKVGWILDLISWGHTAIAFDFQYTDEVDAQDEEFYAYGAFVVQKIDHVGTEIYAGVRVHELDADAAIGLAGDLATDANFTTNQVADPDDVFTFIVGARVKF
ncbi:MAG: porin [Hyphomicrobiales bacterium]